MIPSPFLRVAFCIAGVLLASVADAQQTQYSHGDPTALEQQMLELVNRARLNPPQEGVILNAVNTWYSVAARAQSPSFFTNLVAQFATYPTVEPLAFNPILIQAARAHSQDMITNNYFSHTNLAGQDPTARAVALGYSGGVGENIDGAGASSEDDILEAHFDFMVDYNNIDTSNPLGHRMNTLNSSYAEIGIGVVGPRTGGMITQDFGSPTRCYILGVAYTDANASGTYDAGEGLAGITVTPTSGNWFAVTSTSGGYAIPVDPVQTVSGTVNVPFAVQGSTWASVQPYDTAYRQQQLAAAPNMTVNLTWSGGVLAAPITTSVTMKQPTLCNYKIIGTDGWYYSMSMVTSQNVKSDFTPASASIIPPKPSGPLTNINGDGKPNLVFQNSTGQIYAWFLDGSGNAVNAATGSGISGQGYLYNGGLGDWQLVGIADVNGDGIPDLIFQNSTGQIYAWFLDGSGNAVNGSTGGGLKPGSKYLYAGGLGDWRVVGVGDVNGDGIPDLIFQNSTGQIYAWFLDGSGNAVNGSTGGGLKPGSKYLYAGGMGDWRVVGVGDVNGDGNPDLVFQNGIGQIYAWFLNGSGSTVNGSTGSGVVPGSKYLYSGGLGTWRIR
jgi:uncharacterized protein YkwD